MWDELVGQYKALGGGWCRPHTNWQHHKEVSGMFVASHVLSGRADSGSLCRACLNLSGFL